MSKRLVNGYFSSVPLAQLLTYAEDVAEDNEASDVEAEAEDGIEH
ncbi:MAG: hypothetical protein H6Q73_3507 [Firmicutes bacterium]|nr:hypothetical protein [Bacillota bacterium]